MARAASAIRTKPLVPRLPPGSTVLSLSWLRRSSSSRSGGVGPDDCGPEPQGPLEPPEPHGPPPWLLHGMKSLLPGGSEAAPGGSGGGYMGRPCGFARGSPRAAQRRGTALMLCWFGAAPQESDQIVSRIVVRAGRMRDTRAFAPEGRIDRRKARIPRGGRMDLRDLEPVGAAHHLRIDFAAADY